MDCHFLPGFFAEGAPRLLRKLLQTTGPLCLEETPGRREAASPDPVGCPLPALQQILGVAEGSTWQWEGGLRVLGQRPLPCRIEVFGAPANRCLVGLHLSWDRACGTNLRDLEMVLLGLGCAALAGETQGAFVVGTELGPVGAGLARGTVAEQVRDLLALHQGSVEVVLVPEDTRNRLGDLPAFARRPLGDLWEYRLNS